MTIQLFEPYTIKNITLKNRIVMSPMCMYSCMAKDGKITDWHRVHYTTRAVGQVGLIIFEASAVVPQGRISFEDLGIWSDGHIAGLKEVVDMIHVHGSKAGTQLAHAGRKAELGVAGEAPSAIAFDQMLQPKELSVEEIKGLVDAYRQAAVRAKAAGFDLLEIHAAHGYLINEFLSPLSNLRSDEYGGDEIKRYRFLKEIIDAVKAVWDGPLFVRISATDYTEGGNTPETYVRYAKLMKEQGIDLVDCSSGGLVMAPIKTFPGYQVAAAALIREEAGIATGAVGLITEPQQAEDILQKGEADLIILARELLRNPYWPFKAAAELGATITPPVQYQRGWTVKKSR